jgi:hypothetical protein
MKRIKQPNGIGNDRVVKLKGYGESQQQPDESAPPFRPPSWGWDYVRACLNPSVKATVEARCNAANLHKQRYYEKMKDPAFVRWLYQTVREATFEEANFVRVSHLRLCLDEVNVDPSDRLTAIKLWYEHNRTQGDVVDNEATSEEDEKMTKLCKDVMRMEIEKSRAFNVPLPDDYRSIVERHGIDTGRMLRHEAAEVKDR